MVVVVFFFLFSFEAHNSRPNLTRCWAIKAPKVKLNGRGAGWQKFLNCTPLGLNPEPSFLRVPGSHNGLYHQNFLMYSKWWPAVRSWRRSGYKPYIKPQIFCHPSTFLAKYWNHIYKFGYLFFLFWEVSILASYLFIYLFISENWPYFYIKKIQTT